MSQAANWKRDIIKRWAAIITERLCVKFPVGGGSSKARPWSGHGGLPVLREKLGRVRAGRALNHGFISDMKKVRPQPARGHTGSWGGNENKDPGLLPVGHTRW